MKMTLIDRSNCFRAFLLLIGKDRKITNRERERVLAIGKLLDFEREFCERSIDDLLENPYITPDAPVFSSPQIARSFLRDALCIAMTDEEALHESEASWLHSIAIANGLPADFISSTMKSIRAIFPGAVAANGITFEIAQYI